MLVLGIESSCDETAAAVVDEAGVVLSDVVRSQVALHAPYGGVRCRAGVAITCDRSRWCRGGDARAGVGIDELEGIAVTARPGLSGALLVGDADAKGLAWATG